jgi:DNA adenine methylase
MAKPIVKWAGGKSKLLPKLLEHVPTRIRTYAEPFAGGAALFFALADDRSRTLERAVLADKNEDLVACYRAVRDDVESVITALGGYEYEREQFYHVRDQDPRRMGDTERAARLIYLNRTCFNGLWRVNRDGKFNVPFGRYSRPRIVDADGLRAASLALARAEIRADDFAEVSRTLGAGDFVYFDPPYVPLSRTASFTAYGADGFRAPDQERLAREVGALAARGVCAMLSNADTEVTRELYRDYAIHLASAPRAINSVASRRGNARELIVTSWGTAGVQGVQFDSLTGTKVPDASTRIAR